MARPVSPIWAELFLRRFGRRKSEHQIWGKPAARSADDRGHKNIDYDAKGQRKKIEYSDLGSGARFTTDYTYDKLTFRLTKLKTTRSSPANTLQELSYTFDPSGNIVQISDAAQQSLFYDDAFVAPDQKFVYDAIYRLVEGSGREHRSVGDVMVDHNDQPIQNLPLPSDPNAVRNYKETYSYDEVGNITQMFHDAVANTWTRNYAYTAGTNRLATTSGGATYTHDVHGNMTVMPHLPTITYSPFDQMASAVKLGAAGTVYFTYDSSGQRVRKTWEETGTIKHERIYLGSYEVYRKRASGTVNLERQTLHVNDGAQRIAMVETKTIDTAAPGSTGVNMYRYQLGNHLGSTMLEVDETGLIISYEEYTPYGTSAYRASRSGVDVSARRYRYTGKERDEETGLYHNGARYLAAWLGRWTSADPIGIGADGPGLYNYTRGSPVKYADPSGTESIGDLVGKAGAAIHRAGGGVASAVADLADRRPPSWVEVEPDGASSREAWQERHTHSPALHEWRETPRAEDPEESLGFVLWAYSQMAKGAANQIGRAIAYGHDPVDEASHMSLEDAETMREGRGRFEEALTFDGVTPEGELLGGALLGFGMSRFFSLGASSSVGEPAVLKADDMVAGSVRNVNRINEGIPANLQTNCVSCAIATDATLGGNPASAIGGGPFSAADILEHYPGRSFVPIGGYDDARRALTSWGAGSRGILYGTRAPTRTFFGLYKAQPGHVFNVANQRGSIRFLDAQLEGAANLEEFVQLYLLRTK